MLLAGESKDQPIKTPLEVAERFAEGGSTPAELEAAHQTATKTQNKQRRKPLQFAYAAVKAASSPWTNPVFRTGTPMTALETWCGFRRWRRSRA